MKTRDYRKIAEIIKLHQAPLYKGVILSLSKMLADYFEEEENQHIKHYGYTVHTTDGKPLKQFNKKQFLKNCGVIEK